MTSINRKELKFYADAIYQLAGTAISAIVVFSIGLALSFFQPLLTFLGISQIRFIMFLWAGQALFMLVGIGKSIIPMFKRTYDDN